ncbi:CLUMA_CG004421, isoform A [Clunio marinus]|uniref:CLUMA_CG004421, isoform A n=1 Tax=Clunio marinus TaxID=568069 RepID=A0A1J1HX68_9DIPT|nr:CLUMA_CG004421, isoform A [Clunio marinus]
MSSHPHGMRFSPFGAGSGSKNIPMQTQQKQIINQKNVAMPQTKVAERKSKSNANENKVSSDTDVTDLDLFDDEINSKLSREERYVLLQPRAEPQGQENYSGNVTPVNDTSALNIYEKASTTPPVNMRVSSYSSDMPQNQQHRFSSTSSNRSISADNRSHQDNSGSQRNSLYLQQHSNRNSIDHPHSNRSSLDISQSSYNTLIIHDNNETQSPFATNATIPGSLIKNELYFISSSPSPPNYSAKKDKATSSKTFVNYTGGHLHGNDGTLMTPITENELTYLNQSYVLKHLAKEVKLHHDNNQMMMESTRNSAASDNNNSSSNNDPNWSNNLSGGRNKSKSQPDLTKLGRANDVSKDVSPSSVNNNTLNFNDLEQLEVENTKLREQLNECLMKVAKSQKLEQEVSNVYKVYEELAQSCDRRERLERTARTRLQSDCRRFQELNRGLREQIEVLQQQLSVLTLQQQQQLSNTGRTQQDLLLTQLIQQNKELVDANKRQYLEIQAQGATLEEQRIHINVLDSALKRLEEEVRQKQLYQKQLQTLLVANERREKLRLELESGLERNPDNESGNMKWQYRGNENQKMRTESEQVTNASDDSRHLNLQQQNHDNEQIISEAHSAQQKVNELQTRLKLVENRLAEKEQEDILKQLQEQKLYNVGNSYGLLNCNDCYNTPSSSSIVSSTATTPLIYNASKYDNLMPSPSSSKTSGTSSSSFDVLLANGYKGLYQPNFNQKLPTIAPNLSGISPSPSCSSSSTIQQQQQQHQHQLTSSNASNILKYDESLDEQRKSIDDQLKKLDNQLLTKICCFPSNLLGKKTILPEEMATLTSNSSENFLQNLTQLRMQHESTPVNASKNEDIMLLEKQGLSSQNLRSNLAQVSSTFGQNMTDISNIGHTSKLSSILLPNLKSRQSSAPPSALPRPPRTLKQPRKIEYGRLTETYPNKPNNSKMEYGVTQTGSLKRHQSPVSSPGMKNYADFKAEIQKALSPSKTNTKNYGTIKNDPTSNITKIYYSNKPDYLLSKNYQRLPESPPSNDAMKQIEGRKLALLRPSPCPQTQQQQQKAREGSVSSSSNSRSSSKIPEVSYKALARSRTRTPPKNLNLNPPKPGKKINFLSSSNNNSPTKLNLPSSSVLYHQAHSQNTDMAQHHQRTSSGQSNSGSGSENKYRIQF